MRLQLFLDRLPGEFNRRTFIDITVLDPIDTSSYDTSTSPLFRSAIL